MNAPSLSRQGQSQSLRHHFSKVFLPLILFTVVASVLLIMLAVVTARQAQEISNQAWPAVANAKDLRRVLVEEERQLAWLHWDAEGSGQSMQTLRGTHQRLIEAVENSRLVTPTTIESLRDLEVQHHQQIETMLPLAATSPASDSHMKTMKSLRETANTMELLLIGIEDTATARMNQAVQRAKRFTTYSVIAVIFLMATLGLALVGFRRRIRHLVTQPVEQMAADVTDIDSHEVDKRVTVPAISELALLANEINLTLDRLAADEERRRAFDRHIVHAERMASVGIVASGIVHNLRSPLAVIKGNAQLLQLKHPEVGNVDNLLSATDQMAEMIDDILARGRRQGKVMQVDINQLLRREIEFLKTNLEFKHGVECLLDLTPDLPTVKAVYSDLSQVFENLLRNAVDAMHTSTYKQLTVRTLLKDDVIQVNIEDTGCGISNEDIEHLFDPFYTTKPSIAEDAEPVGTGLGLYTVKTILDRYHAKIDVVSQSEMGSEFRVSLTPFQPEGEHHAN